MSRSLLCLLMCLCATTMADADTPNIVVILADDLGSGDLGCYNPASKIPTPNMDRIAYQGMRFTDAHSPSAVCTPTRYGLLTGRYCWRTKLKRGVLHGDSPCLIEPDRMTIASMLKKHGYQTACIGKWHLGLGSQQPVDYSQELKPGPVTVGFDHFFGIPASLDMEPYVFVNDAQTVEAPTEMTEKSLHRRQGGGGFWRAGPIAPSFKHIDVLPKITEDAVKWIDEQSKTDAPFFLYFPLNAPHTPWMPTEEFQGTTEVGHYGDFTRQVDHTVGQILEALTRNGVADDTLLVMTSDNGSHWPVDDIKKWGHDANMGWRGQKADIHEGGHRVPFIVRRPGQVMPGTLCNETICLTDLFATFAAIVGEELTDTMAEDSFDIGPALRQEHLKHPLRPATVHHSAQGMFAIRRGSWKLIMGLGSGGFTAPRNIKPEPNGPTGQLYNLIDNPDEQKNQFQKQTELVDRLSTLLEEIKTSGHSRLVNE